MRFVLDANVALTWFLSEGEAQTAYSLLVLEDAVDGNTDRGGWCSHQRHFLNHHN